MTKKLLTLTLIGLSTIAHVNANALSVNVWNPIVKGFVNTSTGRIVSGAGTGAYLEDAISAYHNGLPKVQESTRLNRLKGFAAVSKVNLKLGARSVPAQTGMLATGLGTFGLAVGTGIQKFGEYMNPLVEVPAPAPTPTRVEKVKAQAMQMGQKAQDQLVVLKDYAIAHPAITAAIVAGSTGLAAGLVSLVKALRTEKEPGITQMTLAEINEKANNLQHLIYLLRKNGYTQLDVQASDLTTPVVNNTSAAFVVRCLNN